MSTTTSPKTSAAPQVPGLDVLGLVGRQGPWETHLAFRALPTAATGLLGITRLSPEWRSHPSAVRLTSTEAALTCALEHASLAGVLDVLTVGGETILLTEFVDGRSTLAAGRACQALHASFPHALLGHVMLEAARGLERVLSLRARTGIRGGATLALAPEALLITYDGGVKVPVLSGLDALLALEDDRMDTLVPTRVASLAPELLRGEPPPDARAEVFALGATLYFLLTHLWPFNGRTSSEVARSVLQDNVATPRSVNPSIPQGLEEICLRCLVKDVEKRPALSQLRSALETWTADQGRSASQGGLQAFMKLLFPPTTDTVRLWIEDMRNQMRQRRGELQAVVRRSVMDTVPLLANAGQLQRLADAEEFEDAAPTLMDRNPPAGAAQHVHSVESTVRALPPGLRPNTPAAAPAPPGAPVPEELVAEWLEETRRVPNPARFDEMPTDKRQHPQAPAGRVALGTKPTPVAVKPAKVAWWRRWPSG